jgi:MoaA/NifB/PqqE/SkfB family radical SAM enzyme
MQIQKTLAMGSRLVWAKLMERRVPLNLMLSVTNHCPSHCAYCQIPLRRQREMTTEEICGILAQFQELGGVRVGLWGGEPLMRPDIGKIVDKAAELGLYSSMDTNGYLFPQRWQELRNLSHVVIALDGTEEMHDRNREPGSYRKAMAALEEASGRFSLWTITVLTRHNLNGIDYLLDLAREYGFLCTFQILHHNEKLGAHHDRMLPTNQEYRRAINYLLRRKMEGAPIASSVRYLRYLAAWDDYSKPQREHREKVHCYAGRFYVNVDVDGSVYPCSLMIDEIPAPNALEVGLGEAFLRANRQTCAACVASCYIEYNHMYDLDPSTIWDWVVGIHRTQQACKQAARRRRPA